MKCPECSERMEEEKSALFGSGHDEREHLVVSQTPTTSYRCEPCDTEWIRVANRRLIKVAAPPEVGGNEIQDGILV